MGKKRNSKQINISVPANPQQWSDKSRHSVAAYFIKQYNDITYTCWHCKKQSVFTAEEQKYTYEVRKTHIDSRRILCTDCWKESLQIAQQIKQYQQQWSASKPVLRKNQHFLSGWLELLERYEYYVRYKQDTAAKNMIRKLLAEIPEHH